MNMKKTFKKTAALFLGLALTAGATACEFISTDNAKDMAQTIAEVNITSLLSANEGQEKADALSAIIGAGAINTSVPKRDLVSYYLNFGYQYVENYGYTMKQVFEMLVETLVSRKIVTQYAMVYYLNNNSALSEQGCIDYINAEKTSASLTEKEKALLAAHPEVSALKYFLTENNTDMTDYDKAIYSLKKTINDSLDTTEGNYVEKSDETHDHGTVRTTPTGVGTEKEDYYVAPETDGLGETKQYEVYTGRNDVTECFGYEEIDGSTKTTRKKAYGVFLANLDSNGLLMETDNTSKLTEMDYFYVELSAQLEQALITKYTDALVTEGEKELTKNNPTDYLTSRYEETYAAQKSAYDKDQSAFETAIDGLSDSSFALYSPKADYGFVYNILLPFSEEQNQRYAAAQSRLTSESELYKFRASLLKEVKGKDLRNSWFNEHEDESHAYEAEAGSYFGSASNYLFFEDHFSGEDKYETLGQYYGKYAYNGSVTKKDDGSYVLKPNKLDIDEFIDEMEDYMAYATGLRTKDFNGKLWDKYVDKADENYTLENGEFADYSEFMYYTGKVPVDTTAAKDYFVSTTTANKALSAFNELMFAYSTDTGCLNTYMGYMVSPYKTSFVPEFEYAAQYVIRELGAGGYAVCPSTYGWHIIYCTYAYDAGDVYGGFKIDEMETEGSFSYLYAEAMKTEYSSQYANSIQSDLITVYNTEDCVTLYKKAYKDLLEL